MNINTLPLNPNNFKAKIIGYNVPNNTDSNAEYTIEITTNNPKAIIWTVQRHYLEFECLHKLLILKFDRTPYLPCRLLFQLREEEKKDRAKLMETYVNICIKCQEIFNSLEFRLFLDIEPNLNNFVNPAYLIKDICLDDNYPISCSYWPSVQLLFILTSSKVKEDNKGLTKIISGVKGWFGNKKNTIINTLYVLKETIPKSLNFEVQSKIEFSEVTTVLMSSESMKLVSVGFDTGRIISYWVKEDYQLQKYLTFDAHKNNVKIAKCLNNQGIILSTSDDNSLMICDLSDESGYCYEETNFSSAITAMYVYQKKNLLFVGDEKGTMFIYAAKNDKKLKRLQLLLTQALKSCAIVSFAVDAKERYIYIGYKDGSIELHETGHGFEGTPRFINIWELSPSLVGIKVIGNTIFVAHGKGLFTFIDMTGQYGYYSQIFHEGSITDFDVSEASKCIFTIGYDKQIRIYSYNDELYVNKFPQRRGIKSFEVNDIEQYTKPFGYFDEKITKVEATKEYVKTKHNKETEIDDEEDEMAGWDD